MPLKILRSMKSKNMKAKKMSESKNIIEKTKAVMERRRQWAEEYPQWAPPKHREDEAMEDAYSFLNLRRELFRYIEEVKRDSDRSVENIRNYRRVDRNVFELTNELDRRMEEDNELAKDMPNPKVVASEKREATQQVIKRELSNALGNLEGDTLVLIDRGELAEEHAINSNPARFYEKSMTQSLQRQMGRELKKAFAPKRSRVRPESDTISEELDVEPVQKEPTGKFRDVVGAAESEIVEAMNRLLPVDNDQIVLNHREAFDRYLARKMRDAYEDQ